MPLVEFLHPAEAHAATAGAEVAPPEVTVGTVPVIARDMADHLSISSELVPFQEIDVYAKEAGYVKELNVDYGCESARVK